MKKALPKDLQEDCLFFFGLSAFLGQDVHIVSIMKRQMDRDRFSSPRGFFQEALMHGCNSCASHAKAFSACWPQRGHAQDNSNVVIFIGHAVLDRAMKWYTYRYMKRIHI